MVPGKHFPGLQPAEQKVSYEGTAVDFAERHKFATHYNKAWGNAHTGPGIRFVCASDALEDPDHRSFHTQLNCVACAQIQCTHLLQYLYEIAPRFT